MTILHHSIFESESVLLVREDFTQRKVYALSQTGSIKIINIENGICLKEFDY